MNAVLKGCQIGRRREIDEPMTLTIRFGHGQKTAKEFERWYIETTLAVVKKCGGTNRDAARILGIHPTGLSARLGAWRKEDGIDA